MSEQFCRPALAEETLPPIAECAGEDTGNDAAAIRKIIACEEEAWNRGDACGYAAHFQPDGGFTNIVGMVFYGRADFERRHREIFNSVFLGSRLAMQVLKLRFLTADVAVVDIDTEMTGFQALPPGVRAAADGVLRTRLQQVMVKRSGEWWIAAYHNVDVKG